MLKKLFLGLSLCLTASLAVFTACTEECATHDFGDWEVVDAATCQAMGLNSRTCTVCGKVQREQTPALEHEWGEDEVIPATCTEDGSVTAVCKNCGEQDQAEVLQALGHEGEWITVTDPTCTEKGREQIECTRAGCGKTESRDVDALGHSWSADFTIEAEPTSAQDGSMYRECTRCPEKEYQVIPKLDENQRMEYAVTLVDSVGTTYRGNATVEFYDGETLVGEASSSSKGVARITLGQKNYTVKVSGLTAGYFTAEEEYAISGIERQLKIFLSASLVEEEIPDNLSYDLGSVLYNSEFNYFDSNVELKSSTLKEVLATKKGILFNFYYYNCGYCHQEMPDLISASATYRDDIQVILVNTQDNDNDIKRFQSGYGNPSTLWFVNSADSTVFTNQFRSMVTGTPTSIFIDCNGQIVSRSSGAMPETSFLNAFDNLVTRYEANHPTASETAELEAVLPSKNSFSD